MSPESLPADFESDPFSAGIEKVAHEAAEEFGVQIEVARQIVLRTFDYFEVRAVYGVPQVLEETAV